MIGQAAVVVGRGYATDTDKWRRSGGSVRVQSNATFHRSQHELNSRSHKRVRPVTLSSLSIRESAFLISRSARGTWRKFANLCRMSTPIVEDAADDMHPGGVRQGYNYIDEIRLGQIEDSSEGDDDVYSESEESDDDLTRVEDEDWEIAERGTRLNPSPLYFSFDISS